MLSKKYHKGKVRDVRLCTAMYSCVPLNTFMCGHLCTAVYICVSLNTFVYGYVQLSTGVRDICVRLCTVVYG
jgi:hypothetical protein